MRGLFFALCVFGLGGCASNIVGESRAKAMTMPELCDALCRPASLSEKPLPDGMICYQPNPFVANELLNRYPKTSMSVSELRNLRRLPIDKASDMIQEGMSECTFLALMGLPSDAPGNFSSPDPRSPDFSPYLKSTSYFYSSGGTQLSYAFFASRPDLEARKLLFRSKEGDPTYRSINQRRQQGYMGGESDRKAKDEVYLNGIKIPRGECIGAVVAGECKGTAVFPDKPGRKKCYGSIVGGQCVGAEF